MNIRKLIYIIFLFLLSVCALAEKLKIIDDPKVALVARYELIREAQDEIKISYFIFQNDHTTKTLIALLREKALQGVKVQLLIDGLYNKIPSHTARHLIMAGAEIKNFNNFSIFRLGHIVKYRMHDKMFIVDRKKIILGGRNIEKTYYGQGQRNYDDRDVYIEGETAEDAATYFEELWTAKHVKRQEPITQKRSCQKYKRRGFNKSSRRGGYKKCYKKFENRSAAALAKLEELGNKYLVNESDDETRYEWKEGMLNADNITFTHDYVRYRKKRVSGTAKAIYELINNAKESVLIDSPYLITTKQMRIVFRNAIARGVKVRILTNSLKSTDGLLPQAAYLNERKRIARMGIELYEFFGDESLHSKSMVIDGEIAVIGSFNFDPRSQNLNTETIAIIRDQVTASVLMDRMDQSLENSYRILKNGRPEGHKSKLPGVKLGKKVLTRLIQFLVAPYARGLF